MMFGFGQNDKNKKQKIVDNKVEQMNAPSMREKYRIY